MPKLHNKKSLTKLLLVVGTSIVCFVLLIDLLSSVGFILNISITPLWVILSSFIVLAFLLVSLKRGTSKVKLTAIAMVVVSIFISLVVSRLFVDTSYDGNTYHKTAIGQLRDGWNPVYESIESFNNKKTPSRLPSNPPGKISLWADHYTKGSWIYSANIYKITNDIRYGKSLNTLLIIAVLFISLAFLLTKLGFAKAILISILTALSPVALYQIFTNYVDGALGSLIIILLILMTMYIEGRKNSDKSNDFLLFNVVITIALLANIKFTGLVYAGVYSMLYLVFILILRHPKKSEVIKLLLVGVMSLFIGVIVIGSSSYIRNTVTNGNPLYPLVGKDKVDIITYNEPFDFPAKNQVYKFMESTFSKTQNINEAAHVSPSTKIPFTVHSGEINASSIYDVRIGGYGVLFSGILLLSIAIFIVLAFRTKKYNTDGLFAIVIPMVGTAVIICVIDGSWWARYIPQLYLVPLVAVLVLLLLRRNLIAYAMAILLLVNVSLGIPSLVKNNQAATHDVAIGLSHAKRLCESGFRAAIPTFGGFAYNLLDTCDTATIDYKEDAAKNTEPDFTIGRYADIFTTPSRH